MDNIEEIQQEVKLKFGIDISEEEIEAIITSQSRTTKWAIENGEDVMWIYFGKFKIKLGRKGAIEKDENIRLNLRNVNQQVKTQREIKRIGIGVKIVREEKFGEGEGIIKIEE